MRKAVPNLACVVIVLFLSFSLYSCTVRKIRRATPDELKAFSTEQLTEFEIKHGKEFDPEVAQELKSRRKKDVEYLKNNAKSLWDFERTSYFSKEKTLMDKLSEKYHGFGLDFDAVRNARKEWFFKKNPHLPQHIKTAISLTYSCCHKNKLLLGMTSDQVIAAIGYPNDINTHEGAWGIKEQWVYGGSIGGTYFPSSYFYFENGKLTSMQR